MEAVLLQLAGTVRLDSAAVLAARCAINIVRSAKLDARIFACSTLKFMQRTVFLHSTQAHRASIKHTVVTARIAAYAAGLSQALTQALMT